MHNEIPLLTNIAVALTVAFFGGLLARRLGLPTIVGYLAAGVAIGPFTPGFVGDAETIGQLAELGVVFLMFGVGLHFSLKDLWVVRGIALPGALLQMAVSSTLGLALARGWGWPLQSALVLGLAISVASTVVVLRGLMDRGLLNTRHGRVAVGWLVVEDLATVLILVILPAFAAGAGANPAEAVAVALFKAAVFVALMLLVGTRLAPWLLLKIAYTRSRELFLLTIVAIAVGTALGSAELFGVSLALGAFLAGLVVSESSISYQVGAEVVPFRDIFAVLFFVSVGMLVNPVYLVENVGQVLGLTALIVLGKAVFGTVIASLFPHPARTALIVGTGISQIGEFSFLLGRAGLDLGMLNQDQYSLILAGSLLSITLNTFMLRAVTPLENLLRRFPSLWRRLDRQGPAPAESDSMLKDHIVIVGYGRVGHHIVDVLERLGASQLVLDSDPARIAELERRRVPTLLGDAANSELIMHAGLADARALVVTLPEEAAAELVVAAGRAACPTLPIIARASTQEGVARLAALGAQEVIHPELEGGLEIVRHTLLHLHLPLAEVTQYADAVRKDHYDASVSSAEEHRVLDQLVRAIRGMEVAWMRLPGGSPLLGLTVAQADLRRRTGASVIAIQRAGHLIPNPKSGLELEEGDVLGLIGDPSQVELVCRIALQPEVAEQSIPEVSGPVAEQETLA